MLIFVYKVCVSDILLFYLDIFSYRKNLVFGVIGFRIGLRWCLVVVNFLL